MNAKRTLVLKNPSFSEEEEEEQENGNYKRKRYGERPCQSENLMSFVLYWLRKRTGLYLEEFGDISRVGFLTPAYKSYTHIFIEFSSVEKAMQVLYTFHELTMEMLRSGTVPAAVTRVSGDLEQYLSNTAEQKTRQKLQSVANVIRLFGHQARLHPLNPLSLVIDEENEFALTSEGKLEQYPLQQQQQGEGQEEESPLLLATTEGI